MEIRMLRSVLLAARLPHETLAGANLARAQRRCYGPSVADDLPLSATVSALTPSDTACAGVVPVAGSPEVARYTPRFTGFAEANPQSFAAVVLRLLRRADPERLDVALAHTADLIRVSPWTVYRWATGTVQPVRALRALVESIAAMSPAPAPGCDPDAVPADLSAPAELP